MYRNATDFCVLILYPATFLNSFISHNGVGLFFVKFLGFSVHKFVSSIKRDNFAFLFLTWMPFVSFSLISYSSNYFLASFQTLLICFYNSIFI